MNRQNNTPPSARELIPPQARRTVVALSIVLVVLAIGSFFWSFYGKSTAVDHLEGGFFSNLRATTASDWIVEFPLEKTIPEGVGLREWFSSSPDLARIKSLAVTATVTYGVDPGAAWDLSVAEDRVVVTLPSPDLRDFRFSRFSFVTDDQKPLSAEDEAVARQVAEEKLRMILREEESAHRPARLTALRQSLSSKVAALVRRPNGPVEVRFSGESVGDHSP